MNKIFLFLSLVLCTGLQAQTFSTSLSSQRWAGGQCCSAGTDYVLVITGNPAEMEKLVVKAVCVDGIYFESFRTSAVISNGKIASRSYHFSYSSNESEIHPVEDNKANACSNNGRIYLAGKEFLIIEKRTELEEIAYP